MYLKSKLAGVQLDRLYIPEHHAPFAEKIINFVLETPCIDTGKVDFVIEKGDIMTETETNEQNLSESFAENAKEILKEGIKTESNTNEDNACLKDALTEVALLSTMIKVKDHEKRLKALEDSKCTCKLQNNTDEGNAA